MNGKNTPKTASELIDLFGGTKKTAARFNVLPSAVSNWRAKGFPDSMHYRIFKEAEAEKIKLPADFFETRAA